MILLEIEIPLSGFTWGAGCLIGAIGTAYYIIQSPMGRKNPSGIFGILCHWVIGFAIALLFLCLSISFFYDWWFHIPFR